MSRALEAGQVVDLLGLEPLADEGGMFRQVWRSSHGSAIYFLLRPGDFSAMHRLTGPEIWHHYTGAPVQMLLLRPDGGVDRPRLGTDLAAGERPLVAVEAGIWMGAETEGEWSLLGTTMAPAYDPEGFELGERRRLLSDYPEASEYIRRLTRVTPPAAGPSP